MKRACKMVNTNTEEQNASSIRPLKINFVRMKRYFYIPALFMLMMTFSCRNKCIKGDGNIMNSADREFAFFDFVQSEVSYPVYIIPVYDSLPPSVVVYGDANIEPYILTTVNSNNGTLYISLDDEHCIKPTKPVEIYVYTHVLKGITLNAPGSVYCDSLQTEYIDINTSSRGYVRMRALETDKISIVVSGGAEANIQGSGRTGTYSILGSGKISASGMYLSGNCNASISETGTINLFCDGILTADPNDGYIYFAGNPSDILDDDPSRVLPQ